MRKLCADASSMAGGDSDTSVATNAAGTTSEGRATAWMVEVKAARKPMVSAPKMAGPAAATRQRRQTSLTPWMID